MRYFAYCRKSTEGKERQALSIPAQIDEINRKFAGSAEIEIVAWFEERLSAKAPGRPVYGEMIKRIERGEAEGLIAWHPDRLARNSVDGGWIIHLLDHRVLKDLKFVSCMYEQSPQGMFMLQIMFGYSKYYVDNLSENVRRGRRKKLNLGWFPGVPPLGYLNDKVTNTIIPDPDRFGILRHMWDLLLAGAHSPPEIRRIATDQWGLRTPLWRKKGGKPVALSTVYRMFSNPFYSGVLACADEWREGKHRPMVTREEFARAQAYVGRPGAPKPKTHAFAYTGGVIHCTCGLSITAEEKVKPSGRRYTYYRCTRRLQPRCNEPAIRVEALEATIADFLECVCLPPQTESWLAEKSAKSAPDLAELRDTKRTSVGHSISATEEELRVLLDMRTRGLIDDAEFVTKRQELRKALLELRTVKSESNGGDIRLELAACVKLFRNCAVDWFQAGSLVEKRMILQTVGSNCVLSDRKLSIQARIPFELPPNNDQFPIRRGKLENIRTQSVDELGASQIVRNIRFLELYAKARAEGTVPPSLPLKNAGAFRPKQPSASVLRRQMEQFIGNRGEITS